jgi:hypothetical protein
MNRIRLVKAANIFLVVVVLFTIGYVILWKQLRSENEVASLNSILPHATQTFNPILNQLSTQQWSQIAEENGEASVACDKSICEMKNLCYYQSQKDRFDYVFYTIGDNQLYTNQIPMKGEFIRDIPHWPIPLSVHNASKYSITYYKGNTFILARAYSKNIFHFTQKTLPLYDILTNYKDYYPINNIMYLIEDTNYKWQRELWDLISHYEYSFAYFFAYSQKPEDENKLHCFQNVVFPRLEYEHPTLGRPWPYYVRSSVLEQFRQHAYELMGLKDMDHIPKTITVVIRKSDRRIHNQKSFVSQLSEIASPYGVKVRALSLELLSFRQQLDIMRTTGILVAMHGASITNYMFLPKYAVVIEIFPFRLHPHKKKSYGLSITRSGQYNYIHIETQSLNDTILYRNMWSKEELVKCFEDPRESQGVDCASKIQNRSDTIVRIEQAEIRAKFVKALEIIQEQDDLLSRIGFATGRNRQPMYTTYTDDE